MELEKINVTVSKQAKSILLDYQTNKNYSNLDSALDAFLIFYGGVE